MLKNILEYLEETARRLPDKAAFADEIQSLTYDQIKRTSQSIGTGLSRMGYFKVPVAVIMDSRHVPYIQAMLGIL